MPLTEPTNLAFSHDHTCVVSFGGFGRSTLERVARVWRLSRVEGNVPEPYVVERIPWTSVIERFWEARPRPGEHLSWRRLLDEDVLIGVSGVLWLSPGRPGARVALQPAAGSSPDVDELIGAAIVHALSRRGRVPLHGMAATVGGRGVLALGQSMVGKSTLALALLHVGGRLVSDDFLLCQWAPEGARVLALREDLYVREGSFPLIPNELRSRFSEDLPGSGRMVLRREDAPACFADELSPDAVWFLDAVRAAPETELIRLTQAQALASLFASTSPLFASGKYLEERRQMLPVLLRLAEAAACFKVRLGSSLLDSPIRVVNDLLKRATRSIPTPRQPPGDGLKTA